MAKKPKGGPAKSNRKRIPRGVRRTASGRLASKGGKRK